jgi:hypothetical protein
MATNTYIALATVTPSATATFLVMSSIPATYTDLVLVGNNFKSAGGSARITFNSDSTSGLYSQTVLYGNGTNALSGRETNVNYFYIMDYLNTSTTNSNQSVTHIMNYANTSVFKSVIDRAGVADTGTVLSTGLWRNTAAINRIDISTGGGTFDAGTSFTLYGIQAEGVSPAPKATGGAIYSDELYYYHAFGATGVFTPTTSITADILVVAGGGCGGGFAGGGGGAGGLIGFSSQSLTATNYTCTVGAGGAGIAVAYNAGGGNNGTNSTFQGLTAAVGGGYGGATGNVAIGVGNGGSGGGRGNPSGAGTGTANQGFAGGLSGSQNGGGGGAGAAGGASATAPISQGGIGATSTTLVGGTAGPYSFINAMGAATGTGELSGGNYYYAGGGGGGCDGVGNLGGGGNALTSGRASSGGGGGGACGASSYSGNGGSGVIIVRYLKA